MIVNTPEETQGYAGLFGEVVIEDCYRMRQVDFMPDIVFDFGANIGVFSRYVADLFRRATIIAVEPDPENCAHFKKFTDYPGVLLLEKAIGKGQLWHSKGAINGAHQCYLSEGVGYPTSAFNDPNIVEPVNIPTTTVQAVINAYLLPNYRSVLKMDIEGNEQMVFSDPEAMEAIAKMDYIAMELHKYASTAELHPLVVKGMEMAIERLSLSHDCEVHPNHLFAKKKNR
jgi:FkbM family methyltransferase